MPASVYEPIGSALKKSLLGPRSSGLDSNMASSFQKSLLTRVSFIMNVECETFLNVTLFNGSIIKVEFDDAVRQSSNLSEKQKKKYIILTRTENKDSSDKCATTTATTSKLDQVPEPRLTLFRREQVRSWLVLGEQF